MPGTTTTTTTRLYHHHRCTLLSVLLWIHPVNAAWEIFTAMSRRDLWQAAATPLSAAALWVPTTTTSTLSGKSQEEQQQNQQQQQHHHHHPFVYSNEWTGTNLPLLSLDEAVRVADLQVDRSGRLVLGTSCAPPTALWTMARWPDPLLRRPAQPVSSDWLATDTLQRACQLLRTTARAAGAVGLAAQQCGVDARIVFLETTTTRTRRSRRRTQTQQQLPNNRLSNAWWTPNENDDDDNEGMILINPEIVHRSPETQMCVWNEHCLVLPPTFTATVLRDAWVDVDYQTVHGDWRHLRFHGELSRALQHELDHDRGILITDHVSLDELENDVMRRIEAPGHDERMRLAFQRA